MCFACGLQNRTSATRRRISATDNVSELIHVRSEMRDWCVPLVYGHVGDTCLGHTAEAETNYVQIVSASSDREVLLPH